MRLNNHITIIAVATLLLSACNKEELVQTGTQADEIRMAATLQTPEVISTRGLGDNKGEIVTLPYINGIYVRKMEATTPLNEEYNVKNGNKGTLEIKSGETALKWTPDEKANNTTVHFYSWTTPEGVTIDKTGNPTTGTIDFGDNAGNRAPNTSGESDIHKVNEDYVTPLEVFISAHTEGSYKDNPTISLPYTHPVAKVSIQIYNWDNRRITDNVTIKFPFINQEWTVEQDQTKGVPFAVTTPATNKTPLTLTLNLLREVENKDKNKYRVFYLPPMKGDYTFAKAGDFEISYDGGTYYGTLDNLSIHELAAGQHITCRIDLNKNYGTGVGAWIHPWVFGDEETAYANPYRGIYSVEGLKVLADYISRSDLNNLPDSLFIAEGSTKVIRLYNDLNVSAETAFDLSGSHIVFDGLGHIITTANGHNLFKEVSGTDIAIRNIRIAGNGQLATSIEGVNLYNCHAGTADLVGTAKGTTTFDFCSAENSGTLMTTADGNNITVSNSFVASAATSFATNGTLSSIKNSFIINTTNGNYWDSANVNNSFTIDPTKVTATEVNGNLLIKLLNDTSKKDPTDSKIYWVYVYGKNYPVMRIQ